MKKYKVLISFVVFIAIVLGTGFLMKENRMVYNQGDTYYVFDYFTISKFISLLIIFLGLAQMAREYKRNG
jgi:ABC-type transport system involved in multi-copper enzyme maturation permease subunit